LFVVPCPDATSGKKQVARSGGSEPRWRADSKELFYVDVNTLMSADVFSDGARFKVRVPKPLFQFRNVGTPRSTYAVAPGGQRFLFITRAEESSSQPIAVVVQLG